MPHRNERARVSDANTRHTRAHSRANTHTQKRTVILDTSEQVMTMCIATSEHGTQPSATCKLTSRPPWLDEHRNMRLSSPACMSRCQVVNTYIYIPNDM